MVLGGWLVKLAIHPRVASSLLEPWERMRVDRSRRYSSP
jgi:hypothetical protein